MKRSKAPLGASLVVLSSLFYASYGIWTRMMGNFFSGYTASALRSVVVLIILVPIGLAYRSLGPIEWKRNRRSLLGMLIASLVTWGPLYYAILLAGVGVAITVNYAGIVVGMFFFGWLLAGERFTVDKFFSTALSFVGLWLVFSPSISGGDWLALGGAAISGLSVGANAVFAKKLTYTTTQSTVALWTASVVANVLMALVLGEHWPAIGLEAQWLYLILFGIASVAASWMFLRGLKLVDAGAAGILGLLEIVFGVLFGMILFGEKISVVEWLGIILILAAAAIPYLAEYRKQSVLA